MTHQCPKCGSHKIGTRNYGRKAGAGLGAAAGGVAGYFGATTSAVAGAEVGATIAGFVSLGIAAPVGAAVGGIAGSIIGALIGASTGHALLLARRLINTLLITMNAWHAGIPFRTEKVCRILTIMLSGMMHKHYPVFYATYRFGLQLLINGECYE